MEVWIFIYENLNLHSPIESTPAAKLDKNDEFYQKFNLNVF